MSEEDKAPRIVVRDRRAFASDGSRRKDVEPRSESPADSPSIGTEPKPAAGVPAGAGASPTPATDAETTEDPRFKQLISLLFSQAAMLLEQDRRGVPRSPGPPAARSAPKRSRGSRR